MAGAFATRHAQVDACAKTPIRACCKVAHALLGLGLWVAVFPMSAAAQRPLIGIVSDHETGAPVVGVYVALESHPEGQVVGAALTDASGRFVLIAHVGERYRLRAERVGLGTKVTDWFEFEEGQEERRIILAQQAVELEGLSVRAPVRTCRLGPEDATLVQRWWDEVRKALQVTALGEASGASDLRFERFEREWSANLRALRFERQLPADSTPSRPFLAQDPLTLAEKGFVQGREGDRFFYAPDAAVLFSSEFLETHCLRVADREQELQREDAPRPGELLLAVEPTRERPPDIRGLLSVDTITGELRSFDFSYVNLPPDLPRSRAGGHLSFAYLTTGAWVVSDWWIRLPRVDYRWGEGYRQAAVPLVTAYLDQGGRAIGSEGHPVDTRLGRGTIRGVVFDSLRGAPLAGARVSIIGSRYSSRTREDGRFLLSGVPAGRRGLTFHHPNLAQLGLPSPVFSLEVVDGATDTVNLAVPGFSAIAQLVCPDGARPPSTVLTGTISAANRMGTADGSEVRAHWVDGATGGAGRSMHSDAKAGSDGRYVLCDLPSHTPIDVAVRTDSATWRNTGTVQLADRGIVVRDLLPGREAQAIVRGTVRDGDEGTALSGADVWLLAVTGDTVGGARVDSTGAFHMTVAPGMGYRAVAVRGGYLREASHAFTVEGAESLDIGFELVRDPAESAMKIEGIRVEIAARNRDTAKRLLRQYGESESSIGRRWIGVGTLDSIPSTGEHDPGVAISRQAVPNVWVDQASKRGRFPILCVQQRPRRCSLVILDGIQIDLTSALQIDFRTLEGIAILRPEDAATFFGTEGGGGAVILWTRGSGR